MNATLKNEYLKAAFKVLKHQEEHASSVVPYRLDYVFIGSSLEQRNGFVGYLFMAQYPQASPAKCFKAVKSTAFSDDVFDTSVQALGNRIGSAYVPSIQYVFNMSIDSVGRFADLFDSGALHHTYPEAKTIFHFFFGGIGVIAPLKEELLAQISQFQVIVIGLWLRESKDKLVFLPGGKLGLAFAVELSASINCSSKVAVLLESLTLKGTRNG